MKRFSKKKLVLTLAIVLVLGLLGYAVYYAVSSNKNHLELKPDNIIKVERGDMTSVFTAAATVSSGKQGSFQILEGAKVNTVNVRVGDMVKEGDLLATFDASSLDEMLRTKKRDYEAAKKSYQEYMKSLADAPKKSAELKKQIAAAEKKIAALQAEEAKNANEPAAAPKNAQLDSIKEAVASLLGDTKLANRMVNAMFAENGSVDKTLKAFQSLLGGGLFDMSSMTSMMGSMGSFGNTELMSASFELIQLKLQDSMTGITSGMSLDTVYKTVADSAESAYRQAEKATKLLKEGWHAESDGIIREVNIVEGEVYKTEQEGQSAAASSINVTSLLASLTAGNADIGTLLGGLFSNQVNGMVVEYYPFTASFMLGKYDIAKVALDQPAKVTSVSGKEFDATITYISPVAKESSDINLSSLMGGSGTSRGVEARITIPEPDKSITIGLDVDLSIDLETKKNVLRIPVESVTTDSESAGYYVYVLERVSRTIRKQPVETGLFDGNSYYEITSGLEEGEEIVRAPLKKMEDGQRVKLL